MVTLSMMLQPTWGGVEKWRVGEIGHTHTRPTLGFLDEIL